MPILQPDADRTKSLYLQGGKFYIALENDDGTYDDYQYLGMTPSAAASISTETLEHTQTEEMPPSKDLELVKKIEGTLKAAIDQISSGIIAMFFLGKSSEEVQTAGDLDTTLTVKPGYSYMLGHQKYTSVTVKNSDDSVTYVEGVDYTIDLDAGLLGILRDGSISAGDIHVTGSYADATYSVVEAAVKPKIGAKLRFVSDPIAGKKRVWDFHRVQAVPGGDFALKSAEDYAQAEFEFKLLQDASITGDGISKVLKMTEIAA